MLIDPGSGILEVGSKEVSSGRAGRDQNLRLFRQISFQLSLAGSLGSMSTSRKLGAPILVLTRNLSPRLSMTSLSWSNPGTRSRKSDCFPARSFQYSSLPEVPADTSRMAYFWSSVTPRLKYRRGFSGRDKPGYPFPEAHPVYGRKLSGIRCGPGVPHPGLAYHNRCRKSRPGTRPLQKTSPTVSGPGALFGGNFQHSDLRPVRTGFRAIDGHITESGEIQPILSSRFHRAKAG